MGQLFRTWLPGGTTGAFTTRISVFCGSPQLPLSPGAVFTWSCGLGRKVPLRDHRLQWVLPNQVLPVVSPKDTVSNFTGAVIARGVPSNICVPSTRVPAGPLIVIFVPLGRIQVPNPSFVAPVRPLAARPCLSLNPQRLPTPVNSDHLLFFLSGYDPSIVEVLFTGFTRGFPLHYEGSLSSFHAPMSFFALLFKNDQAEPTSLVAKTHTTP